MSSSPDTVAASEVAELYRAYARHLERIVRHGVRAPEPVVEDACQFAWLRLIHRHAWVRRETALAWLVKTAVREAVKLNNRRGRERSLEAEPGLVPKPDSRPGPPDLYEQRERLGALVSLPLRQQRLLWLRGLGLSYNEIATRDGCTPRTVERQLHRARSDLRAASLSRAERSR